jgi:hypothetical protein
VTRTPLRSARCARAVVQELTCRRRPPPPGRGRGPPARRCTARDGARAASCVASRAVLRACSDREVARAADRGDSYDVAAGRAQWRRRAWSTVAAARGSACTVDSAAKGVVAVAVCLRTARHGPWAGPMRAAEVGFTNTPRHGDEERVGSAQGHAASPTITPAASRQHAGRMAPGPTRRLAAERERR